jgi:uncharacterized protein (TIGR02145 family)
MKKLYKNYLMIICLLTLSLLSTKVNAQHFNFEGGNPSEPFWTIYIAEATLSNVDLVAGDEIAIFDGEIMVGAYTLTQVCTPENQFDNVLLAFNTLVSGNNGYTPGNNVLFKCWDASLEIEISDFEISFDNPYGDAWTQSVFPSGNGEYSIVHLGFEWITTGTILGTVTNATTAEPIEGAMVTVEGTSYSAITTLDGSYSIEDIEAGTYSVTANAEGYNPKTIIEVEVLAGEITTVDFDLLYLHSFNLVEGFQFVSSRLIPEDPDIQNILVGILDNLDFVRNSEGHMLRKIGPNWINNIGNWVTIEGYLFKMSNADSFEISGLDINECTPIELSTGYQIISYLPSIPKDCIEVFTDILDNLQFVRNSEGYMLRKIGSNWVNNIGEMQPGEGYLVKMNADDVLIYNYTPFTNCGDVIIDNRNWQAYNTVLIGDQCWLKENLRIGEMINGNEEMTDNGVIEKYCYDNDAANCETYGGLYQWNEMMQYTTTQGVQGICPDGWHLPTDGEWTILTDFLGGESVAGGKMKETGTTHWNSPNTGATNESGFTALPGGCRNTADNFNYLGYFGYFWSSTEYGSDYAWYRRLYYNYGDVFRTIDNKNYGFSSRCLQD